MNQLSSGALSDTEQKHLECTPGTLTEKEDPGPDRPELKSLHHLSPACDLEYTTCVLHTLVLYCQTGTAETTLLNL